MTVCEKRHAMPAKIAREAVSYNWWVGLDHSRDKAPSSPLG